jgi:hypothetical protein
MEIISQSLSSKSHSGEFSDVVYTWVEHEVGNGLILGEDRRRITDPAAKVKKVLGDMEPKYSDRGAVRGFYGLHCPQCGSRALSIVEEWHNGEPIGYEPKCSGSTCDQATLDEFFGYDRRVTSGQGVLDFRRLRAKASDGPEWLIEDVMQSGEFARLYAPAGVGKSLLALQWAVELIRQDARVMYADKENPPTEVNRRLAAMGASPDELEYALPYHSFPAWGKITTAEAGQAILDEVRKQGDICLVIFDSWTRFMLGSETAADEAAAYEHTILPLRTQGIGVLALDHTGHEGNRPRGTSDKMGDVDQAWRLTVRGERVMLAHTKNRTIYGPDVILYDRPDPPARLWHERVTGAAKRVVPDEKVSEVVAAMDELAIPLDWGKRKVRNALQDAGIKAGDAAVRQAIAIREQDDAS